MIYFRTISDINLYRFLANLTFSKDLLFQFLIKKMQFFLAPCGFESVATSSAQSLNSAGYPREYGPNLKCKWKLTVANGQRVQLNFTSFNTELCCDHVRVSKC